MQNISERRKQKLLGNIRKGRLKHITVLPSLITLLNGAFGFAAIVFASRAGQSQVTGLNVYHQQFPFFSAAAYMIFFAMLADMLDGHIARISQSTSSFGGQLDSICDIISFGLAPAFLVFRVVETRVSFHPEIDVFVYRFLWLTAVIYMSCTAIRLARFNVENEEDESNHSSFSGLPSPAAAGVIASLIILNQEIIKKFNAIAENVSSISYDIIIVALPFITLAVAALMVSRIRYPHFVNQYLRGRKPFAYLFWAITLVVLIIYCFEIALAVVFCSFAASGLIKLLYRKITASKAVQDLQDEPQIDIVKS